MIRLMCLLTATILILCLFSLVSCDLLLEGDREGDVKFVVPCPPGSGDINCNGLEHEIIGAVTFNHCGLGSFDLGAADDVTYSFAPGFKSGAYGEVTPAGQWTWSGPDVPQTGSVGICFIVNGSPVNTAKHLVLNVTTTNKAPTFGFCPSAPVTARVGFPRTQTLYFSDPDVCDDPVLSLGAAGNYNPANVSIVGGDVTYTPEGSGRDVAMDIIVSDGDLEEVCTLNWHVNPGASYQVELVKVEGAFQGHFTDLDIILHSVDAAGGLGGFDLLVGYDASALAFQLALEGDVYADPYNWEYFTYRYGSYGNCGNACPSGMLRIVGLAETNNGVATAECVFDAEAKPVLATLRFLVSNDRNLECQYVPVRFFWYDCTDNVLNSCDGSVAYLSTYVYEYVDFNFPFQDGEISDGAAGFPTYQGTQDDCRVEQGNRESINDVDFQNGGIDIICAGIIDARGDINLNGLACEISDAVMFTNYFINGLAAFGGHVEGSIAASDVNADGIALSVADLVYLIRVVVGDAPPYQGATPVAANLTRSNNIFNVDIDMGAAHIVMEGDVTPTLLAGNMKMLYASNGQNTNVLVYSLEAHQKFSGDFLRVNGNVVSTEFATYDGQPVVLKILPANFQVGQNYPNPFCPTTTIRFTVPGDGPWSLEIVDIRGHRVFSQTGVSVGGYYGTVKWDASGLTPGTYFYTVTAGNLSETKKATLLCK